MRVILNLSHNEIGMYSYPQIFERWKNIPQYTVTRCLLY